MGTEPDLTIRQAGEVVVLDLAKDIDVNDMPEVGEVIDELVGQGQRKILVNLGRVTFLASTGVSVFLSKWRALQKIGGDLRFVHVNSHLKNVFRIMEAHRFLTMYDSEEAAIHAFQSSVPESQPEAVSRVMQRVHDSIRRVSDGNGVPQPDEQRTTVN